MSIVLITIQSETTRQFAQLLHARSGEQVALVITEAKKYAPLLTRLLQLYRNTPWPKIIKNLWYGLLLRLSVSRQNKLAYFRAHGPITLDQSTPLPKFIEVESINSKETEDLIRSFNPTVLAVWSSVILKPNIINLAPHTINIHMGMCPYYRGLFANQQAVLNGDWEHVGITIHYVKDKVDTGDILEIVKADTTLPHHELFVDMNDRAIASFAQIAADLNNGVNVPALPQEDLNNKKLLKKDWTPEVRYQLSGLL